jgi:hypothetical protein
MPLRQLKQEQTSILLFYALRVFAEYEGYCNAWHAVSLQQIGSPQALFHRRLTLK